MNERKVRSRGGAVIYSSIKRIFLIFVLVALTIAIIFLYKTFNKKNEEYIKNSARIAELEDQISVEEEKAQQFKKRDRKSTTDEDIEAIARQELGLIKRDEIVIRPN